MCKIRGHGRLQVCDKWEEWCVTWEVVMWWRGGALTLAVKDEAEGVTVVLCSQSDRVIVTSTPHNLLHPGVRGCKTERNIGVEVGISWKKRDGEEWREKRV